MNYIIVNSFKDVYSGEIYKKGSTKTFSDERVEGIHLTEKRLGYKLIEPCDDKVEDSDVETTTDEESTESDSDVETTTDEESTESESDVETTTDEESTGSESDVETTNDEETNNKNKKYRRR